MQQFSLFPSAALEPPCLRFQDVSLPTTLRDNSIWIKASDLARALGYFDEGKVSRIYRRHADEFTPNMTQVIEIVAEAHFGLSENLNSGRCRIFSLRGCHLIAMLARTPVAKKFRQWVLDVLDREIANYRDQYNAHTMASARIEAAGHLAGQERVSLAISALELLALGVSQTEVASRLGVSRHVVYRLKKRFGFLWPLKGVQA